MYFFSFICSVLYIIKELWLMVCFWGLVPAVAIIFFPSYHKHLQLIRSLNLETGWNCEEGTHQNSWFLIWSDRIANSIIILLVTISPIWIVDFGITFLSSGFGKKSCVVYLLDSVLVLWDILFFFYFQVMMISCCLWRKKDWLSINLLMPKNLQ